MAASDHRLEAALRIIEKNELINPFSRHKGDRLMNKSGTTGNAPTPLLITAEEFAGLMQISVRSLWRLRSARRIPEPVQIGGTVRWPRSVIVNWISEGCRRPESRCEDHATTR